MGATNGTGNNTSAPGGSGIGQDVVDRLVDILANVGVVLLSLGSFVLVLLVGWALGRGLRKLYNRSRRGHLPTSRQLLTGKTIVVVSVVLVAAVTLTFGYGVDLVTLFATLGIVSIALGFGLQNTVANLAAGISLSFDRPFDVGDRIHVGETWGDVESVGLRSTRIITVNGEHVAIPNAILDTREVWNATHAERTHMRLDLPVGITYESSLPLAESIMLKVARSNERVLAFPDPVVRARAFGDNAIDLELRVWLKRATQRPAVIDELVRGIKHAFDEEGVHFPFPQRTITYLKDMEPPSPTPEYLRGGAAARPAVMVCTRSRTSAQASADAIIAFAEEVEARLVVVNVRPHQEALDESAAQDAVNEYLSRAEAKGLPAKGRTEVGDLSEAIVRVAREEGVKLVMFGMASSVGFGNRWLRRELDETRRHCPVPVLELEVDRVRSDAFIAEWRDTLHPPETDTVPEDLLPVAPAPEESGPAETEEPAAGDDRTADTDDEKTGDQAGT